MSSSFLKIQLSSDLQLKMKKTMMVFDVVKMHGTLCPVMILMFFLAHGVTARQYHGKACKPILWLAQLFAGAEILERIKSKSYS